MKRFHVHLHVQDLQASIAFYSRLFSAEPTRIESGYAKWMLEDPRVNFAISTRGSKPGLDHLGFQVDSAEELTEMKAAAQSATWPGSMKVRPLAVTPAAKSTGSQIRRVLPGNISTRLAIFPSSMRQVIPSLVRFVAPLHSLRWRPAAHPKAPLPRAAAHPHLPKLLAAE